VHAGTVFRSPHTGCDFDHTSFIATMLKWAGVEPSSAGLGDRVSVAPTFEDAVSATPRSEPLPTFTVPDGYRSQGGGTGALHLGPLRTLVPSPLNWKKIRHWSEIIEGAEDFLGHMDQHARQQAGHTAGTDAVGSSAIE